MIEQYCQYCHFRFQIQFQLYHTIKPAHTRMSQHNCMHTGWHHTQLLCTRTHTVRTHTHTHSETKQEEDTSHQLLSQQMRVKPCIMKFQNPLGTQGLTASGHPLCRDAYQMITSQLKLLFITPYAKPVATCISFITMATCKSSPYSSQLLVELPHSSTLFKQ